MAEGKFQRDLQRFDTLGLDLNRPVDSVKVGKFPYLKNVRSYQSGRIEPRLGLTDIAAGVTGQTTVHSARRLNNPNGNNYTRIIGAGTHLAFGTTSFTDRDSGYSGDPLALVPYRPDQSPESWMYVADRSRMRKINVSGVLHQIGLAPPTDVPTLALAAPSYKVVDEFDVTTGWGQAGTAGAPSLLSAGPGYRTTSTISQILYDVSTTGWACVALTSMAGVGAGERLNFTGGTPEIATVQSVANNFATTTASRIASIIYDAGTSGLCSIALTTGFEQIDVDYLIRNTTLSENVRVLAVVRGPDDNISIRVSTTGTWVAANDLQGLSSFRVYLANSHAAAETVRTDGVRTAITVGTGTLTKTAALDLSLIASGVPSHPDDYMHISLRVDDPTKLTQIMIQLDVDASTNDFTRNYYSYTTKPTDFNATSLNYEPYLGNITNGQQVLVQLNSGEVVTAVLSAQHNLNLVITTTGQQLGVWQGQIVVNGVTLFNVVLTGYGGTIVGKIVQPTSAGVSQWTEIRFRLAQLLRVGTDTTRTLANVATIRISATATASITLDMDSWWIGGGYGPDSAVPATPYLYRYRARIPSTGATSNWSPATRGGLSPLRQLATISLTQYAAPSGTTGITAATDIVLDVQRFGGQIAEWHYVGTAINGATPTFSDKYPDDTVSQLPTDGQDHWQPWPIIGVPVTGTTGTVAGTTLNDAATNFSLTWAPGSQIKVNGIPFTLYKVISTSRLETVESMGSQTGVSWRLDEPTIMAQSLPCLWGDDQLGCLFACGDLVNPGRLYWSNGNDPDSTRESNYLDITNPSEPLMNGVAYNGRCYVFTPERFFQVRPDGQGGWIAEQIPGEAGLFARWAITREPAPFIAFVSRSGVNVTVGGQPISISDADLYPIFPVEGNPGSWTNGVPAPTMAANSTTLRLSYYEEVLYLDYASPLPLAADCPAGSGTVGVPYSSAFAAINGTTPFTFAIIDSALPDGLVLVEATGALTGTPTLAGTFAFTVQIADSAGQVVDNDCTIVIAAG